MSFARMGWDGSDVYVYQMEDEYVCHWCSMRKDDGNFTCQSSLTMVSHLRAHMHRGETVPGHTIEQLLLCKSPPIDPEEDPMEGCRLSIRRPKIEDIEPRVKVKMEAIIDGHTFTKGFKIREAEGLENLPLMLETLSKAIEITIQKELDPDDVGV